MAGYVAIGIVVVAAVVAGLMMYRSGKAAGGCSCGCSGSKEGGGCGPQDS